MKNSWLALVIAAASAVSLSAAIGPPSDVAARTRGAGKVVVARISDVQATFATNEFGDRLIVSNAVLEVLETLKGRPESAVRVTVEGGTIGDLTLRVSDMPRIARGDRGVFFLDATDGGGHVLHERGRGLLKLDDANHVRGTQVTLDEVKQMVRTASQSQGGR